MNKINSSGRQHEACTCMYKIDSRGMLYGEASTCGMVKPVPVCTRSVAVV